MIFEYLFYATVATGGLAIWLLLSASIHRWPVVGVSIIGLVVISLWELPAQSAIASVAGFSIYFNDVVSASLLLVACANLKQVWLNLRSVTFLWFLLGFLVALSLVRGLLQYDPGSALNEARGFVLVIFTLSWSMSLDWSKLALLEMLFRSSVVLGWLLVGMAVYHGIRYGVGNAASIVEIDGIEFNGRILIAGQALVLVAISALVLSLRNRHRSRLVLWSGLIFGAVALLSQNRSVWAAVLAGLGATFFWGSHHSRRPILSVAAIALWVFAILTMSGLIDGLLAELLSSATDSRTLVARQTSWTQLVGQSWDSGPGSVLFGQPFGAGFVRVEQNGLLTTYMPHNWYVTLFLRTGLLGLAAYCFLILNALWKSLKRSTCAVFLLAAYSVFSWTYSVDWYMCVPLGWALVEGLRQSMDSAVIDPGPTGPDSTSRSAMKGVRGGG